MAHNLSCKYFDEFVNKYEADELHIAYDAWTAHLQMFFNATDINAQPQMIAILVLQGGEAIAKHYTPVLNDTFQIVIDRIKLNFKPKNSKAFCRFKLNSMKQGKDEPMVSYVEKLKRILKSGDLTDPATIEEILLQTITVNTYSSGLQKFILTEANPTVAAVIIEASLREAVESEQKSMKKVTFDKYDVEINAIQSHTSAYTINCQMCGLDHNSPSCPASSRSCHKCGAIGHFTRKCTSNQASQIHSLTPPSQFSSNNQPQSFTSLQNPSFYNHPQHHYQKQFQQLPQLNPQHVAPSQHHTHGRQYLQQGVQHNKFQYTPMVRHPQAIQYQRPMYNHNNLQYSYQPPNASINQIQEESSIDSNFDFNTLESLNEVYLDEPESYSHFENETDRYQSFDHIRMIETQIYNGETDIEVKSPTSIINVNNHSISMLLDTGSTTNLLNFASFKNIKPVPTLNIYNGVAMGYAMSPIRILGQFEALLEFNSKTIKSTVLVTDHNCRSILGSSDCQKLGLIQIFNSTCDLFGMYPNVFSDKIGKYNKREVRIHINYEVEPVVQKLRRVCMHQREPIAAELLKMVKLDIIEKVPDDEPTTWVNNIRVVIKKDGDLRITMDTKLANLAILTERYVMPTPDDIRFKLNGMRVLSKMDMNRAYQQFVVDERDRHIMVFATHIGLFRSKRLFFGLKSAAELFQKLVSEVIRDIPGALNVSDDILVFGKNQAEHYVNLHQVLQAIQNAGLTLSKEKCQFSKESLTFYGMQFSGDGVCPTAQRIKAFVDAPPPTTAGEVSSILSSVQFSAGFIKDLATIADPLRKLSHEKGKIILLENHLQALELIKKSLATNALAHFNTSWETELETDASPVGLGACLRQRNPMDTNDTRIIEYASRTLSEVERRWSHIEKELLAAVFGCKKFHLYLYSHPFVLFVDNKPIEMIINNLNSQPSTRMELLITHLSPYHFKVKHRSGILNQADYISRHPREKMSGDFDSSEIEDMFNMVISSIVPKAISTSELALATCEDETLSEIIKALNDKKAPLFSSPSL